MKLVALSAVASLFTGWAALANPAATCTAVAGARRVAVTTDCCGGRMQCAQFLTTTVIVRPTHRNRA